MLFRSYGPNRLRQRRPRAVLRILLDQLRSLLVLLLLLASGLAFAFGEWIEGIAIVGVILINATIGFVTERRALLEAPNATISLPPRSSSPDVRRALVCDAR